MRMSERYCSSCGHAIQTTDHFCQNCGWPVDAATVYEHQQQVADADEGEERLAAGSPRRSGYGAIIVVGIGLLLIAAALGYGVLWGGAPASIARETAATAPATRGPTSMMPGPAVLQDKLVYLRTVGSTPSTATAIPRSPDDAFLVIVLGLPSNSSLYPEDMDWTVLDQRGREFKPAGFGMPLQYDAEMSTPAIYSFFGRLVAGPVLVSSKGSRATINLVFVVPRETHGGTLYSPHKQTSRVFTIEDAAFRLDNAQVSTVQVDGAFVEQPNGAENWTFTP